MDRVNFLFAPLAQAVSRFAQRRFVALETRFLGFLGFARGDFDIRELEDVALGALTGEERPGGWWSNYGGCIIRVQVV